MPLPDMLQEIHFKLMNRIRDNRENMELNELQICPKIKGKLDLSMTKSRDWRATWDGLRKFVVWFLFDIFICSDNCYFICANYLWKFSGEKWYWDLDS